MACVTALVRKLARWQKQDFCISRAPCMVEGLVHGTPPNGRLNGVLNGHFAKAFRFSKTAGKSFLTKKCQGDVLYICDPCEHSVVGGGGDDMSIFRVYKGFAKSKTRDFLIERRIKFEHRARCPYCGGRVWSMTLAKLIPRKCALKKLGSVDGKLEYLVCVNGHLHGTCWLTRLSSDDDDDNGTTQFEEDEKTGSTSTRTSSTGEEISEALVSS
ncbi:hypothetical protein MKW94_027433 [Papaver nudicaule]|uniref:Uncharacterized protein n=1 Tax=Papaver nudicaule TaxID=74823 RepID=A0AA41VYB7_PAPNU|nr:hypothetical protein [Papaver nudicaule]